MEHPTAAKEKTLEDLFHETLTDIYFTEKQILKALPKLAKAANSGQLRHAFETHRDETEGQVGRLDVEEKRTDELLTKLANAAVNQKAAA